MGPRTQVMGDGDQRNKGEEAQGREVVVLQSVGCGLHLVKKEGEIEVWFLGRTVMLLVGR